MKEQKHPRCTECSVGAPRRKLEERTVNQGEGGTVRCKSMWARHWKLSQLVFI